MNSVCAAGVLALLGSGLVANGDSAPLQVKVNRTVPKVEPPKTGLEFSAQPTVQEIFRARVFEEPLVPVGGEPSGRENADLGAALLGYTKRSGPDDFSSLTNFLEKHPESPWGAALLTDLGLEYYNTAHYSLALEASEKGWAHAKDAKDAKGKAIADRAAGELAYMYARLGRMTDLEALLKSVEGRPFVGAATERITGAREGLWSMQHKPEVSFKCGPYALQRILLSDRQRLGPSPTNALLEVFNFPSTQKGVSLPQVAELSKKVGLNYQMAKREVNELVKSESVSSKLTNSLIHSFADFIVPSVVHWKVGHYAAMVRQEGDKYLLEDPTFGNTVWATRQALEAETSGYFLIPAGELPRGWRSVDAKEGASVWGKGVTTSNDPDPLTCKDPKAGENGPCKKDNCKAKAMAVSDTHLMLVSLNIMDTPVGYTPPVGPPVEFTATYNQREARQPANFTYANFGPKWTCNWISYITDNPSNTLADVKYFVRGGGTRTFTGFNTNSQTFALEQFDQTQLKRTGAASYEMLAGDGSKAIFSLSDGAIGTSRKVFLTQMVDPAGNAVTLTYDAFLRLVAITDAIGQITTLTYLTANSNDEEYYFIARVTDPFGRFATFEYTQFPGVGRLLTKITDVVGLTSQFVYADLVVSEITNKTDFINALITPYGTNTFIKSEGGGFAGTTRSLETIYADGSRDRVEFNQSDNLGTPNSDPIASLPSGVTLNNLVLYGRNTYYWSRTACATSYGDYTRARVYHWLHKGTGGVVSGILAAFKEPLENRVWYTYEGGNFSDGSSSQPNQVGRVLDDGQTQLYTYAYNGFGHVTNSIDPIGRTFRYLYASNGIDLLEVRQTRVGNNELLFRATYNSQHRPLTTVGANGQTNTFTYNARGQLLTETNPKGETTSYTYDTNGYLIAADGPLPGTNDTVTTTYDALGRVRTKTDVSGYTLTFDHDDMDRLTKITFSDSTFDQFTYDRLDVAVTRDRAGRQTLFEHDSLRQIKKKTDPLGRVTLFDWCRCGSLKSLTDPMGRTTTWLTDVQERPIAKVYGDGSQVQYVYEGGSSRLRQVIDEKQQITQFTWNRDDTLRTVSYAKAVIATPSVTYTYDPNYSRLTSMADGTGTTLYSYNPVTAAPMLGANQLASIDGPLPNDTITYAYDELGRRVSTAINGVARRMVFDAAGRVVSETNALGAFTIAYDGATGRVLTNTFPNGQTESRGYGNILQDLELQSITHKVGAAPISEFTYGHDLLANRITIWSQQADAASPSIFTFGYDSMNQLLSATVTNAGTLVNSFAYTYDFAANRLSEQASSSSSVAAYNALNQINTTTAASVARTNEWDAEDSLVAINAGNRRTEFTYDGDFRLAAIRQLVDGSEVSHRRFVWCDNQLCEERDSIGTVTKRYFPQGMKVETGPAAGSYFYTRDHLGSIRELTDSSANVRARYTYDPFGRRAKLSGDKDADFGFTGMFWVAEADLAVTRFRAYDPGLGRWLSRDPLDDAEVKEGPNLYTYVQNDTVNLTDSLGLCHQQFQDDCGQYYLDEYESATRGNCSHDRSEAAKLCTIAYRTRSNKTAKAICAHAHEEAERRCREIRERIREMGDYIVKCVNNPCPIPCPKLPPIKFKPTYPGCSVTAIGLNIGLDLADVAIGGVLGRVPDCPDSAGYRFLK
jgi:RHS repeat-associated protein